MKEIICISCPKGCHLSVEEENGYTVTGNGCERGIAYGKNELIAPVRTITSTVSIDGAVYPRCPVKTDAPMPKRMINDVMKALDGIKLKSPVSTGDIVIENVCGTGINIIVTRRM